MLQPKSTATSVWPIPGDVPDLQQIVWAQMATIADQATLIDAYQGVLNTAQAPPATSAPIPPAGVAASAVLTATGTTAQLASVTGVVQVPSNVGFAGSGVSNPIPPGTQIVQQLSGTTSGNGSYQLAGPGISGSFAVTNINVVLTPVVTPGASAWPPVSDEDDLNNIVAAQSIIIRTQTSLLQQYQDLLNTSQTPAPATGP
jgi:hypothetical protein